MRSFLLTLIAVSVILVIVEVICPVKTMKGSVSLSLGLVVLVILVGGIGNLLGKEGEINFENYCLEIDDSGEGMMQVGVENLEAQLKRALEKEGIEVLSVDIDYHINELKTVYDGVTVKILSEENEKRVREIVVGVIELEEEDIWVKY